MTKVQSDVVTAPSQGNCKASGFLSLALGRPGSLRTPLDRWGSWGPGRLQSPEGVGRQGRVVGWAPRQGGPTRLDLAAVCPSPPQPLPITPTGVCCSRCPREGCAHGKAVPTVLRADGGGRACRHFTGGWGVGGEYNQLEMLLH